MKLEFSESSPHRITAFGAHYCEMHNQQRLFTTKSAAIKSGRKSACIGLWLCSVRLFGRHLFYTNHHQNKHMKIKPGTILGQWNELYFLEMVQ